MNSVAEQARFNALSKEDALQLIAAAEGQRPDVRSCWYCNGAHKHLMSRPVIFCFACGFYYLSGYPAQVVHLRSQGKDISERDMTQFEEALQEAD